MLRVASRVLARVRSRALPASAQDAPPVTYRVSFEGAAHHWLEVEATFPAVDAAPLRVRMSRSSPGRYSIHEFAKNVFFFEAFDGTGARLSVDDGRNRTSGTSPATTARCGVVYRIFGDHADGTYMGVDTTHAHLNMPATFMWAVGLDLRPIRVTFVPPAGSNWKAATQLFATSTPFEFTAPNLQYFMDSPTELSNFLMSTFQVDDRAGKTATFRLVVHGGGIAGRRRRRSQPWSGASSPNRPRCSASSRRSSRATTRSCSIYVPWGDSDGMEHRNSTSIAIPGLSLETPAGPAAGLVDHRARVLSCLERRAHPAGGSRAVRLHARERHVLSLACRRIH